MRVRTDLKAGAAANQTEQQLQDAIGAVMDGVQSANNLFNPFALANVLTGQPGE